MGNGFENFSVPGQFAGLDGFVGNADFSLDIVGWFEKLDQHLPAEEFELTPGEAVRAVQHSAQVGDGIRNFLDLDADALTALTAVPRVPQPPVHAVRQDGENQPRDRVREPVREPQPGVVRGDLQGQLLMTARLALDARAEAAAFRHKCALLEKAYTNLQAASPAVAVGTEAPVDTTAIFDSNTAAPTTPAPRPVGSSARVPGARACDSPSDVDVSVGALPVQLAASTGKVTKQLNARIADTVKTLLSGTSKVDDSTTLAKTCDFVKEVITAAAKLSKHYAELVRAASGLPPPPAPTAVTVASSTNGVRADVMAALDTLELSRRDLEEISLVSRAEQLQMRRVRAAVQIINKNELLRIIDTTLAAVMDRRVTGELSAALSDSSSFLQSSAIILSLKGSTAGGRAVKAMDEFTNVQRMNVSASATFSHVAQAALERAFDRVEQLVNCNMTLPAIALTKELAEFPSTRPGMDTSLNTRFRTMVQECIANGPQSFASVRMQLQALLTSDPSLAGTPGYFAPVAQATTSAFGVGVKTAERRSSPKKARFKSAAKRAADIKAGSPSAQPDDGSAQRGRGVASGAGSRSAHGGSRSRGRDSERASGSPDNRGQSPGRNRSQPDRENAGMPMQTCDLGPTCPFLHRPSGCKKEHPAAELASAAASRRDNGSRESQDDRTWTSRRGPNDEGERAYGNFSAQLAEQPDPDASSAVRPNVSFRAALTRNMPAQSDRRGHDLCSRFASPGKLAPKVLKPTAVPPQVDRAAEWARLRKAVLSDAAAQTAAAKTRTMRKHGKTIPALVFEMDQLYEKLMAPPNTRPPALRTGVTQQLLEAFMAEGMPGVVRIVIDTGAEANIVPEEAPLADLQPANALITGASSAVPIASRTVGNLTVVAGTTEKPVHLPVVGAYVVKSLPKNVLLVSYPQLRKLGWRLVDKPGDEDNIVLWSPMTEDGKRRRVHLDLVKHGILTVRDVVSLEAGLIESPSWLNNTSVYALVTEGSGDPVTAAAENLRPADQPSTFFRAFMATHAELADSLPDEEPGPTTEWARQSEAKPVWKNDRCAAVQQPAKSKSQVKRAAQKAKVAASRAEAAPASAMESPGPQLAPPAAPGQAAVGLLVPAPLPTVSALVSPSSVDVGSVVEVAPMAGSGGRTQVSVPDIVCDTGASASVWCSLRPARRASRQQPLTSARGVTAPVVAFIDTKFAAAAEAIRQVAAPVGDFIDYTCSAAVESFRHTLELRGPNRSVGWQRLRAALNRNKAPVPAASSVFEPSQAQLPVAVVVTEGLALRALVKMLQRCATVQLPAASLARLAQTSSLFRDALYAGPDTGNHDVLNAWCRTPEYVAAAACVPCLHDGCNCRLRYQQLTLKTHQQWFEMYPPVHVIAQHLYDRRYGHHNGQRFDSPDDRAAVVRALRGPFPDVFAVYDASGRLSLEWDQHFSMLGVTSAVKSALAAARRHSAWARLDIGADARQVPVTAACCECRTTTGYDLVKCSSVGCGSWVHASCSVPQCPHYLTETDCGTSLYRATRWQCKACAGKSESESDSDDDDPRPELVSTSSDGSGSDSDGGGPDTRTGSHLSAFVPRNHRSLPDAWCPADATNPFNRSHFHRRNPCLGAACAHSVAFFRSQLQPPRSLSRRRPALPDPVPEDVFLEEAQAWSESTVWYPGGGGSGSTQEFLTRFAAGSSELQAWAAADAAPVTAVLDEPVQLTCNMAVVAEPAAAPRNRNDRHRRRRGRSPTEPPDRLPGSRSPEPQRFVRPAPAAPRRPNGRPVITLTFPNGVLDPQLRGHTSTVAHQVNTSGVVPGGLAAAVAAYAPYADVFRGRQAGRDGLVPPADRATPGSIRVDRPPRNGLTSGQLTFVAMYAQVAGGGPGLWDDDAAHREQYFAYCLDAIVPALPRLESIAFPKFVGCEIAGGDWDKYDRMLRHFAGLNPHLQVYVVERGPIARMNGKPIPPVHRHRVPSQSQSSPAVPNSSASGRRSEPDASSQRRQQRRPDTAPAPNVSSKGKEAFDVIASQRAADNPDKLAAAAARSTGGPAPAPALPAVTRLDQLPGVLGVHVGDHAAAGVTYLRRHHSARPKVLMDWGCGSGSAIEAALEVPDMFAVGFDTFDPKDERVLDMLSRWNPRGRPRRAVYIQCLYNRVPTVREIRSIMHREFGLPLTALCIMSGSPNCATLSSAPSSHEFLARGGPPDFEPKSPRARQDDEARIAFMDLLEELAELIPREDPLASFTGVVENPLYGCFRQVRDVRQRFQFSRRGFWTEHSADHCICAAVQWPMKSSCYAIIGDCHHFRLHCRPGQRCRWSTGDPHAHRHALTIVDYNDNAPGQSRVHELDIRRSAIPLRTYHFIYALILKAQTANLARVLDARGPSASSAGRVDDPRARANHAARDPVPVSGRPTPSTRPSTSSAPLNASEFVRQALTAGVSAASAAIQEHPRNFPVPDRSHTPVVLDDDLARQFRQQAVLMLDPSHPLYNQCVTVQEPSHVASVVQQSWQTFATGKIGLLKNPHPTAYGLHCAMLHTRPEVLLHCVRQWAGFSLTGTDGKLIPADRIRLADLQFDGPCDSCMCALTTAPAVRHTRHQLDQARLRPTVHQLSAPSPRVQTRGSVA